MPLPGVQDTTAVLVLQSSVVCRPLWGQGPGQRRKFLLTGSQLFKFYQLFWLCFITCSGSEGVADQTDAGVVTSHHCDVVVLTACQVGEITVGVNAVTFSIVAETALSVDCIRCGAACAVPGDHSDTGLAVHSCCDVGGDTWSWWRRQRIKYVAGSQCQFSFHSFVYYKWWNITNYIYCVYLLYHFSTAGLFNCRYFDSSSTGVTNNNA